MGVVSGQVLLSRLPGYALNGTPLAKDVPSIRLTRTTDMQTVEFPDGSQQVFMSRPIKIRAFPSLRCAESVVRYIS